MRAAVVGAEVHLGKAVGRDLLELLLGGALLSSGEQLICELGRQGLGDVADPGVIGGACGGDEAEAGAGGDNQAVRGRRLLPRLRADLRLPPLLDLLLQAPRSSWRGRLSLPETYRSTVR
ncbi:hypothetical protein KBZ94_21430 [Streptomyces sp. RM72]|nr:hypothetical protein [Streptomyces sp. RM72]